MLIVPLIKIELVGDVLDTVVKKASVKALLSLKDAILYNLVLSITILQNCSNKGIQFSKSKTAFFFHDVFLLVSDNIYFIEEVKCFVPGHREGNQKMVDQRGYVYAKHYHRKPSNITRWRCSNRTMFNGCKGVAFSIGDKITRFGADHDHPPPESIL